MDNRFFERPILNSPYEYPTRHWELDASGQPTQEIIESRRLAEFITPIPKPRKRKGAAAQEQMVFDEGKGLSSQKQQYDPTPIINELRGHVDKWRTIQNPNAWQVTPETARLLQHWRHHLYSGIRPFFCQVEAVETAIWLTEVAPNDKAGKGFLEHLANANNDANPDLMRLALKLATGAGKTTVMAMLIAWQTINAVRRPNSKKFTRGFLVVTPGLTIRDRLRVLQPNDPDSYYQSRELVPSDMLAELDRAKIVITNYHAFKLRERMELSKGGRSLLQGRGEELNTLETEGQMLRLRIRSECRLISCWDLSWLTSMELQKNGAGLSRCLTVLSRLSWHMPRRKKKSKQWASGLPRGSARVLTPMKSGVFVRSEKELARARAAVEKAGLKFKMFDESVETAIGCVSISTMHLAKGLEFRAVVVMACDDEIIPLQSRIESVTDDSDLQEVYDTERHLLYVACTRARDHLFVTSGDAPSEFLDDLKM